MCLISRILTIINILSLYAIFTHKIYRIPAYISRWYIDCLCTLDQIMSVIKLFSTNKIILYHVCFVDLCHLHQITSFIMFVSKVTRSLVQLPSRSLVKLLSLTIGHDLLVNNMQIWLANIFCLAEILVWNTPTDEVRCKKSDWLYHLVWVAVNASWSHKQ